MASAPESQDASWKAQDNVDTTNLVSNASRALQQAVDFSMSCQQPDGHWVAPVSADATFTAQYVMFKYAYSTEGLCLSPSESHAIRRWLLSDQGPDGGWSLAPGLPGNISTSVEAYLALRLLGVPRSHPDMQRAAAFVLRQGGAASVRFFTRFFLATFGLVPWDAIPQMPAELILLPSWSKLNIYVLSSWARSTLIPILIVRHHEPVYALPQDEDRVGDQDDFSRSKGGHTGSNSCSNFLDELWVDPSTKNVPLSRPLWDCFIGADQDRDLIEGLFTAGDNILSQPWIKGLMNSNRSPLRQLSLRKCEQWLLDHQEESGDWAGFFPPIHGSIWALLLQGYPVQHQVISLGLEALERLAVHDARGKWLQSTVSACWDTALMVNALCDAQLTLALGSQQRFESGEPILSQNLQAPLSKAAEWLRGMQLMVDHGDWRIYSKTQQAGGWSFEYYNSFFPDVDDTAVVIMTLVKENPQAIHSKCIYDAVEWILGMQNVDGGWGAFDINNDARWLHKIPFSDMDSLVDPSTADVTGRMLECFGFLLEHRRDQQYLNRDGKMRKRLLAASKPALDFLLSTQETSGAWWGRWGNNYNYGTTNVLRGLASGHYWRLSPAVHEATLRAVKWLLDCQNADGGWGETLFSYADASLAGQGDSTAGQTAWALDSLLRFIPASDKACQRGVMWLIANQTETPSHRSGAFSITPQLSGGDGTFSISLTQEPEQCKGTSWPINQYVGTGFPSVLYLGYPFYHHLFPMQALARYIDCTYRQSCANNSSMEVPAALASNINRPHVLIMALGSRGDIDVFISIAQRLRSACRVRIATHPTHRRRVEDHGLEFYDVGGSPDEYASVLCDEPEGVLISNLKQIMKGELKLAALQRSLCKTFELFWRACLDSQSEPDLQAPDGQDIKYPLQEQRVVSQLRPFVADIIVSAPATKVHVHACQSLQVPLVIVSPQPSLPTKAFPDVLTMTYPELLPGRWWNLASYWVLDFLSWLAFGSFLHQLRVRVFQMPPVPWTWFTRGFIADIPHVCLWSSHLFPRPSEWPENVLIGGYASLMAETGEPDNLDYTPSQSLRDFIFTEVDQTNRQHMNENSAPTPLVVVSLGSMHIQDPAKFLSMLSWALEQVNARAVVCSNWQGTKVVPQAEGPHARHAGIYVTDQSIPHTWLLRHATGGFVHHGGSGHTGAGLRAGVPMFLVPFMLDQHFWAAQVCRLGLGPAPIPFRCLTEAKLAESLQLLLNTSFKKGGPCAQMASLVRVEADGADVAARLILRQLNMPLQIDQKTRLEEGIPATLVMRNAEVPCCLLPTLTGTWRHTVSGLPLSGAAAACLVSEGVLSWDDLDIQPRIDKDYWCGRERSLGSGVGALSRGIRFLAQAKFDFAMFLEPRGHHSEVLEPAELHDSVPVELRVRIHRNWNALSAATLSREFALGA
ncbi:Dammaradiene synthase [Cytospora mali]|uniref:Dammaradiene synthase n=1 Tax=Cytospora mali TaxID=578113 RepID=A0A194VJK1_CYTMA|nr:Dammaradiene synthase [Valsa mali]